MKEKILNKIKIRNFAKNNMNYKEITKQVKVENIKNKNISIDDTLYNQNSISNNMELLKKVMRVEDEFPINSHRKFIGSFLIFGKKIVRKFLRWYIHPLAENQSIYNSYNLYLSSELKDYISFLENKVNQQKDELNQQKDEFNQILNGLKLELSETNKHIREIMLPEINKNTNEMINTALEEFYKQLKNEEITRTSDIKERIKGYADLVRRFNDEESLNRLLELKKENLKKELSLEMKLDFKICIICKNYNFNRDIEAIKKEANLLYNLLSINTKYEMYFISIEDEDDILFKEQGILYVSKNKFKEELDKISPKVVHIFESNPHILFEKELGLLEYNAVFTITGNDPLPGFNQKAIDEIIHMVDNNRLCFAVESKQSQKSLLEYGIRSAFHVLPVINTVDKRKNINEIFTIGFASSPMQENEMEDRGTNLLAEVICQNQDINFKIAWRNKELPIPAKLKLCKNLSVRYGYIDMDEFYSEVNAIIIPYKTKENNHACSLSGMEAMSIGLPVISTKVSGISELVEVIEPKCVVDSNVEDISKAVIDLKQNYENIKNKFIDAVVIDNDKSVKLYQEVYSNILDKKVPLLEEWDYDLKTNNKYLVKSNENIKQYYENQSIAVDYDKDRFISYPMNVVNELERVYVDEIVNLELKNKKDLKMLDIATGTGRILDKLVNKGLCAAIDNSDEMLNIIKSRFENIGDLSLLKGDFLELNIDSKFDIITSFRYIRHFDNKERQIIFQKIQNILNQEGLLIFDVPNLSSEIELRNTLGWKNFNIYDVFWTEDSIKEELEMYDFEIIQMIPIDRYYFKEIVSNDETAPMSWVVAARYKGGS